jgi:hypothetical protein
MTGIDPTVQVQSWAVRVPGLVFLWRSCTMYGSVKLPGCGLSGKALKLRLRLTQHRDVTRGRCSRNTTEPVSYRKLSL